MLRKEFSSMKKSWEKDGEKKVVIGEKNVEKGIFQHEICMALNER